MTGEKFSKMVARLETLAREKPGSYRFRVGALAGVGFAYYLLITLVIVVATLLYCALIIGTFATGKFPLAAAKVFIVAGIFLFSMLYYLVKSLFVKLEAPKGHVLTREQVPDLFHLLDELRTRLSLPPLKAVVLTDDYNASVVQVPKWFAVGPTHHYLVLGFPLMDSLTLPQFKSVLGHEFGHLSGNHGAFSNWIYRVRVMYSQLWSMMAEGKRSDFLIRKFLNHYVPYFDAYSYVLARDNEYDADKIAAEMTSPRDAAEALVSIHAAGRYLDRDFWPTVYKEAGNSELPPDNIVTRLRDHWSREFTSETAAKCLHENFNIQPSSYQTHPSLSARLKSLGFEADTPEAVISLFQMPGAGTQSAAHELLGESYGELAKEVSYLWRQGVSDYWKSSYKEREEARTELEQLEDLDLNAALPGKVLDKAVLLANVDRVDESIELLSTLLEREPDMSGATYFLGATLLNKKQNERGLEYLKKLDENAGTQIIRAAAEAGCSYLADEGREAEAEELAEYFRHLFEKAVPIEQQKGSIDKKTKFEAHQLEDAKLLPLVKQLADTPTVQKAWLVRKVIPGRPYYIIIIQRKRPLIEMSAEQSMAAFWQNSRIELPGEGLIVLAEGTTKWLIKRVRKIPDSLVYSKRNSG